MTEAEKKIVEEVIAEKQSDLDKAARVMMEAVTDVITSIMLRGVNVSENIAYINERVKEAANVAFDQF